MDEYMLTTIDNPYNPFTQFDEWFAFDQVKGHRTCELLDIYSYTSPALTDEDNRMAIRQAIDEIVAEDIQGIFIKVTRKFYETSNNRAVEIPTP